MRSSDNMHVITFVVKIIIGKNSLFAGGEERNDVFNADKTSGQETQKSYDKKQKISCQSEFSNFLPISYRIDNRGRH